MLFTINNGFNWVDVRDVCDIAIESVDAGKPGSNYIVSGTWASFEDIANVISIINNKKTHLLTLPFWTAYCFLPIAYCTAKLTGLRPSFSRGSLHALAVQAKKISTRKVKKEFNFKARPLEETIRDTINWVKKHVD